MQKLEHSIAQNEKKLSIKGTVGSSFAFIVYSIFKNLKRSIFLIFSDKEEATYFLNDIETIDENLNILDVVLLVNTILDGTDSSCSDLNSDGIINILDIVLLIEIILE